mgnify:FL=1
MKKLKDRYAFVPYFLVDLVGLLSSSIILVGDKWQCK